MVSNRHQIQQSRLLPYAHAEREMLKNFSFHPIRLSKHIADQQPGEINISQIIGDVSPPTPQDPSILDIDTPSLVRSMTVFEAENQETMHE